MQLNFDLCFPYKFFLKDESTEQDVYETEAALLCFTTISLSVQNGESAPTRVPLNCHGALDVEAMHKSEGIARTLLSLMIKLFHVVADDKPNRGQVTLQKEVLLYRNTFHTILLTIGDLKQKRVHGKVTT